MAIESKSEIGSTERTESPKFERQNAVEKGLSDRDGKVGVSVGVKQ